MMRHPRWASRASMVGLAVMALGPWRAGPAAAQDASSSEGAPLHVEVEGLDDPTRLTDALRRDLGQPVSIGADRPVLRVQVAPGATATLTYTLDDGSQRTRTVEISADEHAAVVEIALVGSNLVRDQTSDLIAPPEASAEVEAEAEPPLAPTSTPEPASTIARERNLAETYPLHLGLAGYGGLAVDPRGDAVGFGSYGVSLGGTLDRFVSIGITRLAVEGGYSSIEGGMFAVSGTPYVELFGFADPRVQVYAQLGVALQGRTDTNVRPGNFQSAAFLGGGVRFWVDDHFTIGAELGAHLVLTDGYFTTGASLSQLSVPATLGVSIEWHLRP